VEVSQADRAQLEAWLRSQSIAHALATRARTVPGSAAGESIRALAERLKVTQRTVCLWRRRYASHGLDGLRARPRAGRPRRITSTQEQAVVSATLRKPKRATHWSARRLAKEVGLSSATVHRIWQKYGLQPHRVDTFKFSQDPEFDRKLADIVGLYLDPPERALVLCVDEKIGDSGAEPHPADVADVARTCQRASPTTTPATVPPACSPPWRSSAARCMDAASRAILMLNSLLF
jgi:transposase